MKSNHAISQNIFLPWRDVQCMPQVWFYQPKDQRDYCMGGPDEIACPTVLDIH